MHSIGNIEYEFISDGFTWNDGGGAFGLVPKIMWEKKFTPDEYNRIPFQMNCLLIKTDGKYILVDTGIGAKLTPKISKMYGVDRPHGGLVENLAKIGVQPQDIDIVINTHLHIDHCGGNTYLNESGKIVPTFPNAEYWIQRIEWSEACYPNERTRNTYYPENFMILSETGQLKLLFGDTHVASGVRTIITRGHTRSHQAVMLESEGEHGLYVSDMASFSHHFEHTAWVTAYDVEPLENIETKRRWQNWAVETGAIIMFIHDPHVMQARLHKDGKRFKLEPV